MYGETLARVTVSFMVLSSPNARNRPAHDISLHDHTMFP